MTATSPAGRRGRPTEADRARRRDRLLDAAVACFVETGFEATTLDAVAARAGVTKRTIYVDHGDKAALFAAAVDRLHAGIRGVASAEGSLESAAIELVHVLHSDEAVALHRLVLTEAWRFPALAAAFYETGPRASVALLAALLPSGDRHLAEPLHALLLGEPHRRRLLRLAPAPDRAEARRHAVSTLRLLALIP